MEKLFRQLKEHNSLVICAVIMCALSACSGGSRRSVPQPQNVQPDLTFTGQYDLKYEKTLPPFGNDLYTLVVEVRNQGTAPAKSVQVIAHSKGPGIEGDRPPLENNGYYSIETGETVQARFQFIYEKQFSGEYEFTIMVDPSNAVYELNESNNRLIFNHMF